MAHLVKEDISRSRILAVDDSPDNLFLIKTILDEAEYDLTCAENGEEALTKIAQAPPDLVLLDVMMPGMNGYEVTQRIRADASLPYIPILLITAHGHASLVEGLDAGADDFIRKPFDINELQARVRSLLRLKKSMDAQDLMLRQRDDFVARLTHDLRTPLVAANRMLQFCKEGSFGTVADEAKDALTKTIENNEQLLHMVNTLLEVYRHEAGHKALTHTSFNLYETVKVVLAELTPLAKEKQIELNLNAGESQNSQDTTPYQLQGDALELRRVVTNLIGNAIKFTDQGHVDVRMHSFADTPEHLRDNTPDQPIDHWICLKVEDTGIGMSPEDQAEVFEWFRQGKQRRSGSGLGLHLSCRIARMHGGSIEVMSVMDQGSTFTLYLPVYQNEIQE